MKQDFTFISIYPCYRHVLPVQDTVKSNLEFKHVSPACTELVACT